MTSVFSLPGDTYSEIAGSLLVRGSLLLLSPGITNVVFIEFTDCDEAHVVISSDDGTENVKVEDIALDLDNFAGMDRAARWLATHYGLPIGNTPPVWSRCITGSWSLWSGRSDEPFLWFQEPGELPHKDVASLHKRIIIPGISKFAYAAEALRIACLDAIKDDIS